MVLVTLQMNGSRDFQECPDERSAEEFAQAWIKPRRKSYPHARVIATYYSAEQVRQVEDNG